MKRGLIKAFREYLNRTQGFASGAENGSGWNARSGAKKRLYGDYLYNADRDMFLANLHDALNGSRLFADFKAVPDGGKE